MNLLRTRTLILAVVCSFGLTTSVSVPAAHASIWSFLKRHILGSHTTSAHKQKVAHHQRLTRTSRWLATDGKIVHPTTVVNSSPEKPIDLSTTPISTSAPAQPTYGEPSNAGNDHAFSTRASWYGPGFDGKRTASGARFNQYGLTAASRTLPLGSKVLVANPTTGKCCTVTINDRGPYVTGRDIDLSRGAAGKIGVTGVSSVVCVAYANSQNDGFSSPGSGSDSQPGKAGRRGSKHRRRSTALGTPERVTGKVMHLIAGIL